MITKEQLSSVMDHPVHDTEGKKIGDAKHIFLDDATGRPEWVTVKTGLFGTHESFVPVDGATITEDHLEVAYPKSKVKDAPNVDVDAGGHLSESEEHRLFDHYGIDWDAAWKDANRPGERGWAAADTGQSGTAAGTAGGAAGASGAAAGTAAGAAAGTAAAGTAAGKTSGKPSGMPAGTAAGGTSAMGADATGTRGDATMTRSEEQMHVGIERHESGRARLRKYVVTEEQQQTVPVRHEEVHIEREPISETDRGTGMTGPEIAEAEQEVTLYAEEPVVETRAVPVERVRLTTEEQVEQRTVEGTVRKERIEAELPDEPDKTT